ncbi:MAG: xanthine dehydrogenase family protein subunit M [Alphaproteobacteria bacterium]|nr:xanthine dehydrogenase family protein subunit M [Alphaproteobacteria bacterium]MBT5162096.1 xanthine dehydrogenase family protein subunit M [Alphaproteobacteria bacterium]MBT5920094.1 xanthine dehydrogenase family protein subunit M [Alphaproteobacteria bacterium]MBT6386129.1 xanthine dehydrogenase family protein subunit M [Alphaproteobacteria bacterium]
MLRYFLPDTVAEATAGLAEKNYRIVAGGTDFYPALADQPVRDDVMDISGLQALRGIARETKHTRIGALATWTDIARAELPNKFRGLQLAAREVGALQIQNVATVAGNLCNASPAADGVPPLLTLNAQVEISAANGQRVLPLDQFILGNRRTALEPNEMLTAILIPNDAEAANSHFMKLGSRQYLVISYVMVATLLEADDSGIITQARVSVGACSEVACRLADLEAALVGQPLTTTSAVVRPDHLSILAPIDDIRASADYRLAAALEYTRRSLSACTEGLL